MSLHSLSSDQEIYSTKHPEEHIVESFCKILQTPLVKFLTRQSITVYVSGNERQPRDAREREKEMTQYKSTNGKNIHASALPRHA